MESQTTRFLRGKKFPGVEGKVVSVQKWRDRRIIKTETGEKLILSKRQLIHRFNKVLAGHQLNSALKSIRPGPDLRVTAWLGGAQKGTKKTYVNIGAARRAIRRHYHLAGKSK